MICPNCHHQLTKEKNQYHCLRCGYISTGHYLKEGLSERQETILEKALNSHFYKLLYNNNFYVPFLVGPLYFGYYQLLLIGIILENLEIGFFLLIAMKLSFSTAILIILFTHILYSIYANQFCIFLWKKKLKKNPQLKLHPSMVNPFIIILSVILIFLGIFLLYQANIIPHGLL